MHIVAHADVISARVDERSPTRVFALQQHKTKRHMATQKVSGYQLYGKHNKNHISACSTTSPWQLRRAKKYSHGGPFAECNHADCEHYCFHTHLEQAATSSTRNNTSTLWSTTWLLAANTTVQLTALTNDSAKQPIALHKLRNGAAADMTRKSLSKR